MFKFVVATVGILVIQHTSLRTKIEATEDLNVFENLKGQRDF